ncbi:MAG TPA: septal ring lytic transglycosylase RlpA family protein [Vampirovibrionales bacterium]
MSNPKSNQDTIRKLLLSFILLSFTFISFSNAAFSQYSQAQTTQLSGKASWIGERFQGRKTASGESFDMNDLTAAHASLPFNTKLKVTSQRTGKSVVVRVNDRSQTGNGRLIDLSKKAAQEIGLIEEGVGFVNVQILANETPTTISSPTTSSLNIPSSPVTSAAPTGVVSNASSPAGKYQIQYGSFFGIDNAIEFKDALKDKNIFTKLESEKSSLSNRIVYRVKSAEIFNSKEAAKIRLNQIEPQEGIIIPVSNLKAQSTANTSQPETAEIAQKPVVNNNSSTEKTTAELLNNNKNETYEFGVQFNAFSRLAYAQQFQETLLKKNGIQTIVHQFADDEKKLYRVLSSKPFTSKSSAISFLSEHKYNPDNAVILTFVK